MDRILESVALDLVDQIKGGVAPAKWGDLLDRVAEGLDVEFSAQTPTTDAVPSTPSLNPTAPPGTAPPQRDSSVGKPKMMPNDAIARGEFTCIGACGRTLSIKKFPTPHGMTGGNFRLTECRDCREGREKGRGGDGSPPPWSV